MSQTKTVINNSMKGRQTKNHKKDNRRNNNLEKFKLKEKVKLKDKK